MRLTKLSRLLMDSVEAKPVHHTKRTDQLFLELYDQIQEVYKKHVSFVITERRIRHGNEITKPSQNKFIHIPYKIAHHIEQNTRNEIHATFNIGERNIRIIFAIEDETYNITVYKKYAKSVAIWLHIISGNVNPTCSKILTVYFYLSRLTKTLPVNNIITEEHANTGFTNNCTLNAEIVIYRKEEWFKVFLHESFHNFNMDFSGQDNSVAKRRILSLFKVESEVRLYEAYTEMWAEIINVAFCSYYHSASESEFLDNAETLMGYERQYSLLQMNKVLASMGTSYPQLFVPGNGYREKTNIFSYFVIKGILMNEHQQFMQFCKTNNNPIMFIWSADIHQFCNLIERNMNKRNLFIKYGSLDNKMRMSICELG